MRLFPVKAFALWLVAWTAAAGCSAAPAPSASPHASPEPSPMSATPTVLQSASTATPSPTQPLPTRPPTPTAWPTPTTWPTAQPSPDVSAGLLWQRAGSVDQEAELYGLPFGYLDIRPYTTVDSVFDVPLVRFSPDFNEWHETTIGGAIAACPGWDPHSDTYIWGKVSGADRLLLLTMKSDPEAAICDGDNSREVYVPTLWSTSDGVNWTTEPLDWPFGEEFGPGATLMGAWAVDGRWEIVIQSRWVPITLVLTSEDGVAWREIARFEHRAESDVQLATGISSGGTRLIAMADENYTTDETTFDLFVSDDGATWREIESPFTGTRPNGREGGDSLRVLAPGPGLPIDRWVFSIEHADCFETERKAEFWVSPDLAAWQSADFPWIVPRSELLVSTRYGVMARGGGYCDVTGGPGPVTPEGDRLLLSTDGLNWQPLRPTELQSVALTVIEGPAGVFLVSENGQIWGAAPGN